MQDANQPANRPAQDGQSGGLPAPPLKLTLARDELLIALVPVAMRRTGMDRGDPVFHVTALDGRELAKTHNQAPPSLNTLWLSRPFVCLTRAD